MGGTVGSAPVAMMMDRVVKVSTPTSTDQGEVILARPCRTSTPRPR